MWCHFWHPAWYHALRTSCKICESYGKQFVFDPKIPQNTDFMQETDIAKRNEILKQLLLDIPVNGKEFFLNVLHTRHFHGKQNDFSRHREPTPVLQSVSVATSRAEGVHHGEAASLPRETSLYIPTLRSCGT